MWRAMAKGAAFAVVGNIPGGAHAYRVLTRELAGTQATHVDKLARVWPGYISVWRERCGLALERADVWVHEGGYTPFASLMTFLLTGRGGTVTNVEARVNDRYLSRAVDGVLGARVPVMPEHASRRLRIAACRWSPSAREALASIGATLHEHVTLDRPLPLPSDAFDLCHSGGALEHYRPDALRVFLAECYRSLRPGGLASHVFDHRDHLHHADPALPFLAHLALPDAAYEVLCGHALGYHSRLSPTEVQAMFSEAGFERVAVRRMTLPAGKYVEDAEVLAGRPGLARARLAAPFRGIAEIDLRTAAAHYVYRKPRGG